MEPFVFLSTEGLEDDKIWLELARAAPEDPGRGLVPTYHFVIRSRKTGEKMGLCDLRIGSKYSIYYAGNIGYRIYERFQGNHYAARACMLMFRQAAKHGMEEVSITCSADNAASRRTCELVGANWKEAVKVPKGNAMYARGYRLLYRYVKWLRM